MTDEDKGTPEEVQFLKAIDNNQNIINKNRNIYSPVGGDLTDKNFPSAFIHCTPEGLP